MAEIPKETNLPSLFKSLNALLPDDITISELDHCDLTFHPRFSAKGKIYRYSILTQSQKCPFSRHTKYHHPYPIDISLIKEAIPLFTGRKDFSSFANFVGKNSKTPSPIKTIFSIDVEENESGFSLIYHGDGFLYKMVRNITGALINYGQGKLSLDELRIIIENKKNAHKLFQAPAHGLCLESVLY
jgi:tRNA pseudouridine38-40 synthase